MILPFAFAVLAVVISARAESTAISSNEAPEHFKKQILVLYNDYLDIAAAFVASDPEKAKMAGMSFVKTLDKISTKDLRGSTAKFWADISSVIKKKSRKISETSNLELQRLAFSGLSNAMYKTVKKIGVNEDPIYHQYCPMAFNDKGGYWLSDTKKIANPYFGDKMLRCGLTKETLK
jgi:membrane fusion protein, copper/silver efflux system